MGANFSAFSRSLSSPSPATPSLGDLPEDCVASIISYLEPPEICKLARLNKAFRGASWADFVWASKLPENYEDLIKHVVFVDDEDGCRYFDLKNLGLRDVYAMLCRCNSFDYGTKKAWLDKSTGGVCLSIGSKGLAITGIDDRRYWNYIPTEESRFRTVAYLQQTWWFEVAGGLEFPFPAGTYSVYFRLQLGKTSKRFSRRICNPEHVHGWDVKPVKFELSTSDGQHAASKCFLDAPGKWVRYHVGDFVVENSSALTKIKFSMTQIDCTHTKGGLSLDSVQIYPKNFILKGKSIVKQI